ncbi:tRNA preQ1(34) S-adenosylmethionine ribosyltransferase-isomerase QueA [bacterium]|nr:tRNA preQ1(34) S-adenosylmethionine ribosyltransferase-isomerase QueA [bacterium]
MKVSEFIYELPPHLIAQEGIEPRDSSRLLVLNRKTGEIIHLPAFREIVNLLNPGDLLVLNDTEVIPAKLKGRKDTGGKVEVLILEEDENNMFSVLLRPSRRIGVGRRIIFSTPKGEEIFCEVVGRERGIWKLKFPEGVSPFSLGELPLPPYIKKPLEDPSRYQTVYAKRKGSLAAPTAGLHFTPSLLDALKEKGVEIVYITLKVGLGTFKPIRTENVEEHKMEEEEFEISVESAEKINKAKEEGRRVIAVGTTVVRTLESAEENGKVIAGRQTTSLFIYPGYKFKIIDALITNFHLPASTPLLLTCAFAGKELIFKAYEEAKRLGYRFLSLGDAMFII